MCENFQKGELPTLLQFVRVRAAHQPHVSLQRHEFFMAKVDLMKPMSFVLSTATLHNSGD